MNDKLIFEFSFYNEMELEDDNEDCKVIFKRIPLKESCTEDDLNDVMQDYSDIEEKYGVHDISGGGDADGRLTLGFTTYEVEKDKIDELMSIWYDRLNKAGLAAGPVEGDNDWKDQ